MKWIKNDVLFERSNYEPIIAKFDNSKVWLVVSACCTQQTARSLFKELGEKYAAKVVEIKKMYSSDDQITEKDIVGFLKFYDGTYLFRNELNVPEGQKRQFITFLKKRYFKYKFIKDKGERSMSNKNQYRGRDGRFERCTVEKVFGIEANPGYQYRCSNCGHIFAPILVSGKCPKCECREKTKVDVKE